MIQKEKRVFFKELEHKYVNFLIRIKQDNIRQGDFFRFMIDKYLEADLQMLDIIRPLKERTLGKRKLKISEKDHSNGRNLLEKMGITEKERDDLFDIIEKGEDIF